MESLYTLLASEWEGLFPPDEARHRYLMDSFRRFPGGRILEVGCGTGATARRLAEAGFAVTATDPDSGMVAAAKAADAAARYDVDDMLGSLGKAGDEAFHGVLCLGNTLPHLRSSAELTTFFAHCGRVLVPGGRLIVQILAYGAILRKKTVEMPVLRTDGLEFRRRQISDPTTGFVVFRTEVAAEGRTEIRENPMLPITADDLVGTGTAAGLARATLLGDWDGRTLEPTDPWFVAVFEKGTVGHETI